MNYLVANLQIEGIFLSHKSRIAYHSSHFKEPTSPCPLKGLMSPATHSVVGTRPAKPSKPPPLAGFAR